MISGGSQKIAQAVADYLSSRRPDPISFNSRVTKVTHLGEMGMEVETNGSQKRQFSHVISTLPLPVLRTIDLRQAGLSIMQSNALRELNYGPSIKVGMQFKTAWWTTGLDGVPLNIVGGQTYTDRPLRTVVYPSFGDVAQGKTTTLIASYCWTEDAERFSALIDNKSEPGPSIDDDDQFLINLVIRELADIHGVTVESLNDQLIATKAWSWSRDPLTMGKCQQAYPISASVIAYLIVPSYRCFCLFRSRKIRGLVYKHVHASCRWAFALCW
jgi:monoamine oxidase